MLGRLPLSENSPKFRENLVEVSKNVICVVIDLCLLHRLGYLMCMCKCQE